MKIERITSGQAVGLVRSKSVKEKGDTDAMEIIIAFGQISCVDVIMNVVFFFFGF